MTSQTHRWVAVERRETGRYTVRSARGAELEVSTSGEQAFTPVELLLAAIATCTAADVDVVTARRAEAESFTALVEAEKVRDDGGNVLRDLRVTFDIRFPPGEAGDAARAVLPRALSVSHDRTCTVSRTVEAGTPVAVRLADAGEHPAVDGPAGGEQAGGEQG
ncbi:MAG TPA: OsmC family protein [Actinotalea sp.]|jgi:uncharacterized OsmC-like protein